MKYNKNAQSALEFLTTYGWAFLVILIMIAALAYLGVLNPTTFLGDSCTVSPGFRCTGVTQYTGIGLNNEIAFEFVNNLGHDITINRLPEWNPGGGNPSECVMRNGTIIPIAESIFGSRFVIGNANIL